MLELLNKLLNNTSSQHSATKGALSREEIIEMLKTSPEKLDAFESYYKTQVLPNLPMTDNLFTCNAKQVAEETANPELSNEYVDSLVHRIVDELLALTTTFVYDGKSVCNNKCLTTSNQTAVTNDEIKVLPKALRPQLTGSLMTTDLDANDTSPTLLWFIKEMQETTDPVRYKALYNHFRQGLDILDLDGIAYEMLGMNPNAMSHWLPELIRANDAHDFFKIPKTVIAKVPLTLLQLTRTDYMNLTATTKAIINQWAMSAFGLELDKDYFIKTGTYSSKFDFRNCHVYGEKEVAELGEYLTFIQFQASQMASPLSQPIIYGVSTTNEWVVREFIPDKENNPVIYKGLPLHTEYRLFIDADNNQILGCSPYWDPEVMKKRFDEHRDGHDEHDAITYAIHEDTLMRRFNENKDMIVNRVKDLLPDLQLHGQWSLDIMQNGDDFWLIDMALAENSAGYDKYVQPTDRKPSQENWIPCIE